MTDDLSAVITWVDPEAARPGPLAGKRLLVKDLIDTAGVRTTYGSRIYGQHVPQNSLQSIVPDLATEWSWAEDNMRLTFRLGSGHRARRCNTD